jgi:hypothetical protein
MRTAKAQRAGLQGPRIKTQRLGAASCLGVRVKWTGTPLTSLGADVDSDEPYGACSQMEEAGIRWGQGWGITGESAVSVVQSPARVS